jgi:enoyl-CoA hydratase
MSCDFLIASDRATFADTHARVGVLPGGGMSIRLPQLIGIDRARRMSLTGNFIDAHTAYDWGLVTEVVAHDQLLPRAIAVARDVADADPQVMTALRALYDQLGHRGDPEDYLDEARQSRQWMATRSAPDHHDDVITRGRSQQPPAP